MSKHTILIVEDERVPMKALQFRLQTAGYQVLCAANAPEAVEAVRTQRPDLMILDLNLIVGGSINGLSDGLALLHYLRRTVPGCNFPVIIHTAENPRVVEPRARAGGVAWIFKKGPDWKALLTAVSDLLRLAEAGKAA